MTKDDLLTIQDEVILPILHYSDFGKDPKPNTAWYVGGAVRDMKLGRQFNDIDLVVRDAEVFLCNAQKFLSSIKAEFSVRHMSNGHATILHVDSIGTCKNPFLYPIDIEVSQLKGSLVDDALSRDFRCNAWYMEVGDLTPFTPLDGEFQGGNPYDSDEMVLIPCRNASTFEDNPLRIFRAADLIARGWKPSFELYYHTHNAVVTLLSTANTPTHPGPINDGLRLSCLAVVDKIIKNAISYAYEAQHVVDAFNFLTSVGGWAFIHKDIQGMVGCVQKSRYHKDNVWQHTMSAFKHILFNRIKNLGFTDHEYRTIAWAILLHDVGKTYTRTEAGGKTYFVGHEKYGADLIRDEILRGFDNDLSMDVVLLVRQHMATKIIGNDIVKPKNTKVVRKLLHDLGSERRFMMWVALATADDIASERRDVNNTACVLVVYHQMKAIGEPDWFDYTVPLTGSAIREALNIKPEESYMIGIYLDQLLNVTFAHPEDYATTEQCLHYIKCLGKDWKAAAVRRYQASHGKSNK